MHYSALRCLSAFLACPFFQFWKTIPRKFPDAYTWILLHHRMQNLVDKNETTAELEKRMCKSVHYTVDIAGSVRLRSCFLRSSVLLPTLPNNLKAKKTHSSTSGGMSRLCLELHRGANPGLEAESKRAVDVTATSASTQRDC
jgi:hypothetical protein